MEKGNTEIYLTTGEFAKLCGVNKRTLFHYDDIDLLKPAFTDEKGYRSYSHHQLDVFLLIQALKELKLPLKEVREYMNNRTPQHMIDMANLELPHIQQEIEKLQNIHKMLKETIVLAEEGIAAKPGQFKLAEYEEERLIRSGPIMEEDSGTFYLEWTNQFLQFDRLTQSDASSFIGTMTSVVDLLENKEPGFYFFVKTASKRKDLNIFIKPKGWYAIGYHHGSYERMGDTYEAMFRWIEQQGLSTGEFLYEEYLIDDVAAKDKEDYVTRIMIEIKPKEASTLSKSHKQDTGGYSAVRKLQ
ncbi:MerR family transcriptional regulator [Paenibacillus bovis]|uniref:MerR family transcriptional regulator n=1 Tax=Paenibacillus bovis TaxID=1616788 RepID=A0A172ZDY4_9BACL|nr:MerR family transcriptional regulator [Paenibacillus bovis]ANF95477.1 MerR family transcriptional regulator [Paenibacillus bovis]